MTAPESAGNAAESTAALARTMAALDPPRLCDVDGCERPSRRRGWCEAHYLRYRRNGHLELLDRRKAVVGYHRAHDRIRSDKGRPDVHPCVECGKPAQQWAYDNSDPDELIGETANGSVCRYSLSPDHYQPFCIPCHRRFDYTHRVIRVISTW